MTNQNPKLPQFSSNSSAPHKHNQAQTLTWPVKQHMACLSQQHSNHHDPEGSKNTFAKCTQTYFWLNTRCTAAFEMFANNNQTRAMQLHSSENDRNTLKQKTNRDHMNANQGIPGTRTTRRPLRSPIPIFEDTNRNTRCLAWSKTKHGNIGWRTSETHSSQDIPAACNAKYGKDNNLQNETRSNTERSQTCQTWWYTERTLETKHGQTRITNTWPTSPTQRNAICSSQHTTAPHAHLQREMI